MAELTNAVGTTAWSKLDISGPWPPHPEADMAWSGPALGAGAAQAAAPIEGGPTPREDDDGTEMEQAAGQHGVPPPPAPSKAATPFGALVGIRQVASVVPNMRVRQDR